MLLVENKDTSASHFRGQNYGLYLVLATRAVSVFTIFINRLFQGVF